MAKKFAKINGLFNVFVLKTDNNTQYYDPAKIIDSVVDIDKNTICFVSAAVGDVDKKIGEYTIKENDRFVITQGGIYAYTGKQYSEPVIPDTPDTPIEDTWRPIYINSTPINELEFTKEDEYGDIVTIKPINPALDFTTPKTIYEEDGVEYGILKIDDSYDDIYDIVSMEFGVDYSELKRFIESVLPSKETIGNGNLAINVNGTNSVNFTANQTTDSEINFVSGDNINITIEDTTEDDNTIKTIKISAQVESPKNGKLSFTSGDVNSETENTFGEFSANQEESTSIKFLAGDNISLEASKEQLTISANIPSIPESFTTKQIIIAEDIEIGGTELGNIIARENIFDDDIIKEGTTLHDVLVKIFSGEISEDFGEQNIEPFMGIDADSGITFTVINNDTGEEIDLSKSLIELEEGTEILVTLNIEAKAKQTLTISGFVGGYAEDNSTGDGYIEHSDTIYQRNFSDVSIDLVSYQYKIIDGFTNTTTSDLEPNRFKFIVGKDVNKFTVEQTYVINPEFFNIYNIYPISNLGNIGNPIIIDYNKLFDMFKTTDTLTNSLQITGIAKELLPYYIGIVNNGGKMFDFSKDQEIDSETLVTDESNGIRIEKYVEEAPKIIEPTTYTDDLQLFIAVPANQFKTDDWLVSVFDPDTDSNFTELTDNAWYITKNLSISIDGKPYYLWCVEGKDSDCTFDSIKFEIELNK